MNFIAEMRKVGEPSATNRPRKAIPVGDYGLSVQANEYAYCRPRENGLPLTEYYLWEVGLMIPGRGLSSDEQALEIFGAELGGKFETGGSAFAGYVETADVQRMYDALAAYVATAEVSA